MNENEKMQLLMIREYDSMDGEKEECIFQSSM